MNAGQPHPHFPEILKWTLQLKIKANSSAEN